MGRRLHHRACLVEALARAGGGFAALRERSTLLAWCAEGGAGGAPPDSVPAGAREA